MDVYKDRYYIVYVKYTCERVRRRECARKREKERETQ